MQHIGRSPRATCVLTSQQHASVSQGRICTDNFTCCHTEIELADQTFHLTQSQYTDTGPTSPSTDPITPGAWQGSHRSASFEVTGMTRPGKIPGQAGFEPGIFRSRGGRLNHWTNEAACATRKEGTAQLSRLTCPRPLSFVICVAQANPSKRVPCDIFLQITAMTVQFLPLAI